MRKQCVVTHISARLGLCGSLSALMISAGTDFQHFASIHRNAALKVDNTSHGGPQHRQNSFMLQYAAHNRSTLM
jgi:hypothetical protein